MPVRILRAGNSASGIAKSPGSGHYGGMKALSRLFLILVVMGAPALAAQEATVTPLREYRIGRDLEAQGRWDEANTRYETAIALTLEEISKNTVNRDTYAVLTWSYQRQKKYRSVIDYGKQALKRDAKDYRVMETMGEAWFYIGDYKESIRLMQKYVDAMPQGERVSVAYFFMGETYRILNKLNHAEIAYTTSVRLEPGLPLWWYRLGLARELLEDKSGAQAAFNKALSLWPSYKDAKTALARVSR